MRTSFTIIIIDNPSKLVKLFDPSEKEGILPSDAASMLERQLIESKSINNVRVRCNDVNMGASASRNRGG